MTDRPRLRDSAKVCPAHFDVPGEGPLRCQLDAGHDGKHAHECTRWGTTRPDNTTGAPR